jgi:hypothetical protein
MGGKGREGAEGQVFGSAKAGKAKGEVGGVCDDVGNSGLSPCRSLMRGERVK